MWHTESNLVLELVHGENGTNDHTVEEAEQQILPGDIVRVKTKANQWWPEKFISCEMARLVKKESSDEETEQRFLLGDIVWIKIKPKRWWPAQVHNRQDGSETILQSHYKRPGGQLVAMYGEVGGAWCYPSQMLPLVENFAMFSIYDEDDIRDDTFGFPKAIRELMDELGRLVQGQMVCRCIPEDRRGGLARPVVESVAVRKGVRAPEVDMSRLRLPEFEADEVLANVEELAKIGTRGCSRLDVAVMRGWLTAFYRFKGCHRYELQQVNYGRVKKILTQDLAKADLENPVPTEAPNWSALMKGKEETSSGGDAGDSSEGSLARTEDFENGSGSRQRKNPYMFQACQRVKKRKPLTDSQPTLDGLDSTANDDFVSDVKTVTDELAKTISVLEKNQGKFSAAQKASLTEEFEQLGEQIETVVEKVKLCANR